MNIIANMMMMAVQVPSPSTLFKHKVDAATIPKKIMSPAIATVQPARNPCPATLAAARPVIGSTPNAIITNINGPGVAP